MIPVSELREVLDDLRELSLSELKSVQSRCMYLIGTKHQEETRQQEIDRLIGEHNETREPGAEWVQPTSALDAYPKDAVVTHAGHQYRSTVGVNVWRPTESGWRELSEGSQPPAYEAPTGAHDAYQQGERITYDGTVYEAVRDGVVHSPSEYPPDWREVEDSDDE